MQFSSVMLPESFENDFHLFSPTPVSVKNQARLTRKIVGFLFTGFYSTKSFYFQNALLSNSNVTDCGLFSECPIVKIAM